MDAKKDGQHGIKLPVDTMPGRYTRRIMNHRQIIALTPTQRKWLASQADKHGISITEVIRRLLDKAMS
jgi:hypothetical protein